MNASTVNKIKETSFIRQQKRKDECSKVHNNNIITINASKKDRTIKKTFLTKW